MSCNCCQYFHKASSVTTTATNTVITLADAPTGIVDTEKFCFIICQSIPSAGATLPVVLVVNGANVPLWNKYGDVVNGGDLKTRCIYKGYYGVQGADDHIIATNTPNTRCYC